MEAIPILICIPLGFFGGWLAAEWWDKRKR
jgi:hypothetical protein